MLIVIILESQIEVKAFRNAHPGADEPVYQRSLVNITRIESRNIQL